MTELVWKEYRQNRLIVCVLFILLMLPYLFLGFAYWKWGDRFVPTAESERLFPWIVASLYSLGISQLAIALIGGNAIAGERVDRSAEFQCYLPISRRRIFAAKMLLFLTMASAIWLPNAAILWYCHPESATHRFESMDQATVLRVCLNIATTGLTFFCVAWCVSSIIKSPTFAICAGLVTPLIVIMGIVMVVEYGYECRVTDDLMEYWFRWICLSLSSICFLLGSWLFLRRVEP